MTRSSYFILLCVALCSANELFCQIFDESTQSLEEYCENYRETLPVDCSEEFNSISPLQISQLKIIGCDNATVLEAAKRFHRIHTLDISYSEFKTLKWFSLKLERLAKLNASYNELVHISSDVLQKMPDIVEIDLSHNNFERINSTDFHGINRLAKIYFGHNFFSEISYKTLWDLWHLEYIDLSYNYFTSIPIFPNNQMLKTIRLEENPISTFGCTHTITMPMVSVHISWKNLISFFGHMDCDGRRLRVIRNSEREGIFPVWSGKYELHCNEENFNNLRYFVGGVNGFDNIADIIPCLGSFVTYLDLSGNNIEHLSNVTFHRFIDLNRLYLSDTNLISFDFAMLQHQQYLVALDISFNNLQHIKNIALLKQYELNEFNVAGNYLTNLPEMIEYITSSVEQLDLSGNYLGDVNVSTFQPFIISKSLNLSDTVLFISDLNPFQSMNELNILDISHNYLKNVNFTILGLTLNRLNELYAADCEIEDAIEVIHQLGPSIEALDLSGNTINSLNSTAFEILRNLQYLNLSHANMVNFEYGTLHHQSNLLSLDLSFNRLREIDLWLVSDKLERLYLDGNELLKINDFDQSRFPRLCWLAISNNYLNHDHLIQIVNQSWDGIVFVGDPFQQKHAHVSSATTQAITDFLYSVYDKIKFW